MRTGDGSRERCGGRGGAGRGRIQRRGHVSLRRQGGKGRLGPRAAWGLATFRMVPGRGAAPGRRVGRSSGLEAWHRVVGHQRPSGDAGRSTRPVSWRCGSLLDNQGPLPRSGPCSPTCLGISFPCPSKAASLPPWLWWKCQSSSFPDFT